MDVSRRNSTHRIEAIDRNQNGNSQEAIVFVNIHDRNVEGLSRRDVSVELRGCDFGSVTGKSWHVLGAFNEERSLIEAIGLVPKCFGSCVNLILSGMAADMGEGYVAYLIPQDKSVESQGIVSIFDSAEGMWLGTIAEQEQFREKWFARKWK